MSELNVCALRAKNVKDCGFRSTLTKCLLLLEGRNHAKSDIDEQQLDKNKSFIWDPCLHMHSGVLYLCIFIYDSIRFLMTVRINSVLAQNYREKKP